MAYFTQQLVNAITLGAIYGLIAIGYTMVYGIIGMINFAHGEIYMIGAYLGFIIVSVLPAMTFFHSHLIVFLLSVLVLAALRPAGLGLHRPPTGAQAQRGGPREPKEGKGPARPAKGERVGGSASWDCGSCIAGGSCWASEGGDRP